MLLATLLIAAQEEQPAPLIDLDGTLFVQWALFLIMMAICSRYLFKPYLKLRDERRANNEGAREEAQSMKKRALEMVESYDQQLQRARLRGAEERQRLRAEGAGYERETLGAARDEAHKALEAARQRISTEAATAREQLEAQSATLSRQIVRKILGREVA
jgi:F-type H+-transporting ATPase subunit b